MKLNVGTAAEILSRVDSDIPSSRKKGRRPEGQRPFLISLL